MIYVRNHRTFRGKGENIDRNSVLGNRFVMNSESERIEVIMEYRLWLWNKLKKKDMLVWREIDRLLDIAREGDLNLLCWCAPKHCHGHVLRSCLEWMLSKETENGNAERSN